MKKLITLIVLITLLFNKSFAMETNLKSLGDFNIDVFGMHINNKNYQEIFLNIPGMDNVKLFSENTIFGGKSNSPKDDSLKVVIIPINKDEDDAYKWFIDKTEKIGNEIKGYYLAFYRGSTPCPPDGKVVINLDLKDSYKYFKLYYMNGNGQYSEIGHLIEDNKIVFKMSQSGYYIISKIEPPINPTEDSVIYDPNDTLNIFKTGDNSEIGFYTLTFLISSTALAFNIIKSKKSKRK